jgi:hypothetical protein
VAEHEAKAISARTKAASAQSKKKSVATGVEAAGHQTCRLGTAAKQAKANAFAARVLPAITAMQAAGKSRRRIAAGLTGRGVKAARGGKSRGGKSKCDCRPAGPHTADHHALPGNRQLALITAEREWLR